MITNDATYGSTLRLIGTIQKLKAVQANAVSQAECDRHPPLPYCRGSRGRPRCRRARALPRAQRARARVHRRRRLDRQRAARLPLARRPLGAARSDGRRARRHALARSRARLAVLGRAARRRAHRSTTRRTPRSRTSRRAASSPGVVTQNIDGLHHAAGSDAVEVHGHLRTARCMRCGAEEDDGARARALCRERGWRPSASSAAGRCGRRSCSSASRCPARPGASPPRSSSSSGGCLCVGTSLQVYPAAGLAEAFARARRPLAIVSRRGDGALGGRRSPAAALGRGAPARRRGHTSRRTSRFTLKLSPQEAARAGQDPSQPFECRCPLRAGRAARRSRCSRTR